MTDNSPRYFSYISKADLAHLRKSQAGYRGWCGQYRREIERLEAQAKKCIWCGAVHERGMNTLCPLTIAEAQIAAVKGLRKQNYHQRGINQQFVWVHELEAALQ